ncbi:biotin transport system substrate-specific component [Deinobacterium chartae]|uniref:Biotin transporter n=1 Tax=Deinobacterium chartae TaxID=521158 RepID=A0A841I372_9DEIO|nr:biotin transporter BioY [Deinobacterium chartae]MBB6098870.1 biotin transport system substrate-specific component [Deinobacterium chartae]
MNPTHSLSYPPLLKTYFPQRTLLRDLLLIVAGTLLLALLAQVRIPTVPVPITGQTLGVLLIGAALGARLGFLSMSSYLLAGAVGLPFFTGAASGPEALLGATGGYLFAMPFAAGLVGLLVERFGADRRPLTTLLAFAAGSLLIYAFGVSWLAVALKLSAAKAVAAGMLPFLPGDALKAVIAAGLLPSAWKWVGRR